MRHSFDLRKAISMRSSSTYIRFTLAILVLCSVGCGGGDDGPQMYVVSGTVSMEGSPVETGRILFRTAGAGKAFSADINDGAYELEAEAGEMAVEITASRIIPGKFDNSNPDDEPQPVGEMYIPAKYNSKTELKATVNPDGENEVPFNLTSK